MTARRFLPLVPLLLAACLFTAPFAAQANNLTVRSGQLVERTNNDIILSGNGVILIEKNGEIRVTASSPNTIGGTTSGEPNTGILLRGVGSIPRRGGGTITGFFQSSSNNTITNNGEIIVSGSFSEGVHVINPAIKNIACYAA